MTYEPRHDRPEDEVPAWLEEVAHTRLVDETVARLRAVEAAAVAAERARDGAARQGVVLPAQRSASRTLPGPAGRLARRVAWWALAVEAVAALLLVALPLYALLEAYRARTPRPAPEWLEPALQRVDGYFDGLDRRLLLRGGDRLVRWLDRVVYRVADAIDAALVSLTARRGRA